MNKVGQVARRALRGAAAHTVLAVAALTAATAAALAVPAVMAIGAPASADPAAGRPAASPAAPVRHVVVVGVSGLRWSLVTPAATPALWRLASGGSVGSLVDYAEQPLACPADGWLTLNGGARAAAPGPCTRLPAVVPDGPAARVPSMPRIIAYNQQFHESPDWGLLGGLPGCATAVGPGAALALAGPSGTVSSYLPSPSAITAGVLARCPLTVIDLGSLTFPERISVTAADRLLARVVASLPPRTLLLVTAPGAAAGAAAGGQPHLQTVVVAGPGYADGLLHAASTRQPGIVTLTDLTPTIAGWLGHGPPSPLVGARITSGPRGSLAATVRGLTGRDTAEQVWTSTHGWFFAGYGAAAVLLLGAPALACWGADPRRRQRRCRCWRTAGAFLAAVPLGTFLANLVPWWLHAHPAAWLYGMAAGWTLVIAGVALAGPWRRDPLGPAGAICLSTLGVLGVDVMTGSRLQLETPFGLSLLEAGRFYGIGNEALGVYCVSALTGAAWLGMLVLGRFPARRAPAVLAAAGVGLFAVVASGWPGFGDKAGSTIALVPCFLVLLLSLGDARVSWRRAAPIAVSGLALFAVFALVSYFVPAAGASDLGSFAGSVLHGHGGALLARKAGSNVGTLTVSAASPLVPLAAVVTGVALWRPSWLGLRILPRAFAAQPLLRVVAWLAWLVLVLGWFADDSGVIVPAAAIPFAVPLLIMTAAGVFYADARTRYRDSTFVGSSAAGHTSR